MNLPERGKSAIAPRHDQEGHNSQRDEPQGPSDDDDVDTDETDVEDDLFDKLQEVFLGYTILAYGVVYVD